MSELARTLGRVGLLTLVVACGSQAPGSQYSDAGPDGNHGGKLDGSADGKKPDAVTLCTSSTCGDSGPGLGAVTSLSISPAVAELVVNNGVIVTQAFKATAKYSSGATGVVSVAWSASDAAVGAVDVNGLYTPKGVQGGVVTLTATLAGQQATASLTIQIHQVDDQVTGGTPTAIQSALEAATTALGDAGADAGADAGLWDPTIQWTYPYNETVLPRGLAAPQLMWSNGNATDVYYIHLTSPTYNLESFANAATPSRYDFNPTFWTAFTNSTAGAAELVVARYSGSVAKPVVEQRWTIGSGSMSGTIYYWAINEGAVVRIKPGATAPDTFLADASVPLPDGGKQPMQCPSCHSISADGTQLLMSTGPWGASTSDVWSTLFSLQSQSVGFNGYEQVNTPPSQLALAGITPDGKMAVENWAVVRGSAAGKTNSPVDLSQAATTESVLPAVTGTGLETLLGADHAFFPAFSPDNQLFVYVDSTSLNLIALDWNASTKVFSSPVTLATGSAVANTKIAYPTLSPDHRWVVYQRGPDYGSLDTSYTGDLYAVDTQNPGTEIPLNALNGVGYPFAAGAPRDANRDYEPTFAPVAAGGYFWVVFHSRRTYGNQLTGPAFTAEGSGTKQLWVAAIDITPTGVDPSHEPFWLPGQDLTTLNMRGYWSLPPCAPDGQSCATGSDCCDGFCDETNDAGAPVCGKPSTQVCSNVGDTCKTTSDCCTTQPGVTCINSSCAAPAPR